MDIFAGLKIAAIGFLLVVIGVLVGALGVDWLGIAIACLGMAIFLYGFVTHAGIFFDRLRRKRQSNGSNESKVD